MTIGNKKIVVIGVTAILILIISLMAFGIIDLSLYKANFNNQSDYISVYNKNQGSYALEMQYKGKTVYNHQFVKNNEKPINVIVKIEDYQYDGNYYWPLVKNFTLNYSCTFSCPNLEENDINNFNGGVKGSIKTDIIGMCSIRKTKMLVEEKALESIKKHIIDTLQTLNKS